MGHPKTATLQAVQAGPKAAKSSAVRADGGGGGQTEPKESLDPLVTIVGTLPPELWIALAAAASSYCPAGRLTHECPGHLMGPIYMAIHLVGHLQADLQPALRTHLQEHVGCHVAAPPRSRRTPPHLVRPNEMLRPLTSGEQHIQFKLYAFGWHV